MARKVVPFTDSEGNQYEIRTFGGLEGHVWLAKYLEAKERGGVPAIMQVPGFVEALAKHTLLISGGKTPVLWSVFDEHFSSELPAMIEWMGAATKANFTTGREDTEDPGPKQTDETKT